MIQTPLDCWQLLELYRELWQSHEQSVEPELQRWWRQSESEQ